MTSKTIMIGLVALAFVAGTIMTGTMVSAEKDDDKKGNPIVDALNNIAAAINGIEPNISVEPTPITIEAPAGPQGIPGEQGPQGIPGEQGPQGIPGDLSSVKTYSNHNSVMMKVGDGGYTYLECDEPGDIAIDGSWNFYEIQYPQHELSVLSSKLIQSADTDSDGVLDSLAYYQWKAKNTGTYDIRMGISITCLDITP